MAFTTPGTAVAGEVLTAAFWNTNVRDNIANLIVPPACRAERAVQTMNNGSIMAVNFDTEAFDTDGMFSATSNFITIKTAGIYVVTASVGLAASASGNRIAFIYRNPTYSGSGDAATITGGTILAESSHAVQSSTVSGTSVTTIFNFAVNDKVALGFFQNSGLNLATADGHTHLAAAWTGRTS
jgi:hypothetical protein